MVRDPSIIFSLRYVHVVVPPHFLLMTAPNLISERGETLVRLKIELHLFVSEHLPEHRALIHQVHQHKEPLAQPDQVPLLLDPFLDLVHDFLVRVLARLQVDLVLLERVVVANVHDLQLYAQLRLVVVRAV